jgi:predicted kinase
MLIVLIGQSGSGKSYLAKKLEAYDNKFVQVSSDVIRKELLGDVNCQDNGGMVFAQLGNRLVANLKKGKSVIWDSTNLTWSRTKKSAFTYAKGAPALFVFMMDSLDHKLCKKRVLGDIAAYKDRSMVPESVMDKQHERFLMCKENALKDQENVNIFLYKDNFAELIEELEKWDAD